MSALSPDDLIAAIPVATRRADARLLLERFARATGEPATVWGSSIIAFGSYHYRYASGREGDAPAAGFAARASTLVVYVPDRLDAHADALARLGAYRAGKGCLYLKSLADIDLDVLIDIVTTASDRVKAGSAIHGAGGASA